RASPSDLTFFDSGIFSKAAAATHAGACLTTTAVVKELSALGAVLTVNDPYRAFVTAARVFFSHALRPSSLSNAGDLSQAHVDKSALTEEGVSIDAGAVVGPRAEIGSGSGIGANAVIGAGVRIGRDCSIGSNTTLTNALIGDRVIIHPGCKIGQDGFGFVMGGNGHLRWPEV